MNVHCNEIFSTVPLYQIKQSILSCNFDYLIITLYYPVIILYLFCLNIILDITFIQDRKQFQK